jgi:nucleotide-binding universal stress UspA family protein
MYHAILLAVALQNWERYSAHAVAARDVAGLLAKGAAIPLHVLSVYEYERIPATGLSAEMDARYRADQHRQADVLMARRMDDFIAPLKAAGIEVKTFLQVGKPREVIVKVASGVMADLLIIGSHSKRGIVDMALGGTARRLTHEAPCTVLMVSPKAQAVSQGTTRAN